MLSTETKAASLVFKSLVIHNFRQLKEAASEFIVCATVCLRVLNGKFDRTASFTDPIARQTELLT